MKKSRRYLKVFLCHSSGDKPIVEKYYDSLVNEGFDAWLDNKKLLPGQDWESEIQKAVREADAVIIFLSSQSINKEGFVQKEVKIALDVSDEKPDGTIFIIPARIEICEVPRRISKFQWVDLFNSNGYDHLVKALQVRAKTLDVVTKKKSNAEKVLLWLQKYQTGDVVPEENWELYQKLLNSMNTDTTGRLLFSKTQLKVMTKINQEMKRSGLAITLPDKTSLHKQLLSSINDFPHKTFLEKTFFPAFLEKSSQDVEVFYFLRLLIEGINTGLPIVKNQNLLIETVGAEEGFKIITDIKNFAEMVTRKYPTKLIEVFWRNPEVVKYLKQVHESMFTGFS